MIREFDGKYPRIDPTAFIADDALVIGDVTIQTGANIWFQSIVRGDINYIRIGRNCNIQDGCILHVVKGLHPLILEEEVVLGHRVVVHGCKVARGSLIGIGAIVLNGATVGEESIIGAGSVVTPGTVIPPRSLAVGNPARVVRTISDSNLQMMKGTAREYLELKEIYSNRNL
jgi:carbonic anhydrase/acetyltransferase-like protein (isoleucine patch superfamily)